MVKKAKKEKGRVQKQIPQNPPDGGSRDIAFILKARLPQITRFFPAEVVFLGKVIFWTLIFGFLVYNFLPLPFPSGWKTLMQAGWNSSKAHVLLGEEFLANNQLEKAEAEFLLAQRTVPLDKTLEEKVSYVRILRQKKEDLEKETTRWEKILRERPNYRDAYLELAMLNYQLKREATARDYLAKAKELDPNFPLTKELEKILKISN